MNDKILSFTGTLAVEGDLTKLDLDTLKSYLERAVCLDLDNEEHGTGPDEHISVTGIGIDWESLK
jgi:hypothetical protein